MTKTFAIRLHPGEDLKGLITEWVKKENIRAGWMVSCVGSLQQYAIRFANEKEATVEKGYFEILQLSGTVSLDGVHLHIMISDKTGQCIAGHLMDGSIIYTTAELVISTSDEFVFSRETDQQTGFKELVIHNKM